MIRVMSIVVCAALAGPAVAATAKEKDCTYQSDVVASVQAARVARVGEGKVATHVADTSPAWPEKYNAVVPLVTPWIYSMKMAEVKKADLAAAWKELCLSQ
ncbi:hypothetical protein OS189_08755 [Sulfitobacter sp. F26169L]|uniref:hypothetical protein n=1 Tax=Sulfitobacter sp. F26169L TaxID=2996015 RepID=UPI002260A091|nr:hypothetical protein [Sulfitobacter sp. F26169L]MCX7566430.1 hypothetical protein [Sulfitobacter sp. F26169L]